VPLDTIDDDEAMGDVVPSFESPDEQDNSPSAATNTVATR